ncbi:MAG: hypothetical protein M3519_10310 [Actinomycetota bacterium]|nr:hypothetical protein [Actinomycetota bacterium]
MDAVQRGQQHLGQVRPGHARRAVVGTRDAQVLAELVRGRLRTKIPALTLALVGRFGPTLALIIGEILVHLDYLDEAISRVSASIDELTAPFAVERDLLTTVRAWTSGSPRRSSPRSGWT